MPIHDWTRAPLGYFHHFHQQWAGTICDTLNAGLLPKGVFALVEQYPGATVPDVLALETRSQDEQEFTTTRGGQALLTEPPRTRFVSRVDGEVDYVAKANRVAVYRQDETVAVIEIVSPGNKSNAAAFEQFVAKSVEMLDRGIHLLVVDLFPPTRRDPEGIHPAIWGRFSAEPFALPPDKPLTLASYLAGTGSTAYVEPVAVGDSLPDMPIFIGCKKYVPVPLEETYQQTWKTCPEEFRQRVTSAPDPVA